MNPKDILNSGGILLYPTDTLYGLGVDALSVEALKKLRVLKGREDGKPISIVVSDMKMAEEYAEVTPLALKLAEAFLPGKVTLILKAKSNLPTELTAGTGTVGIRIPNHILCLNIVRELGRPYTATSANVSDMDSKNTVSEILAQFGAEAHMIDRVIDVGELLESLPSTVVDARGLSPHVIREGAIAEIDIHAL
ncbi:threonylcarbamoyl-AMP synthase [Patescibacteria group bacterium]|nr:MAG: threonylcarbamoyl-AMP synthase [Patescibacteria group bacterium]